MLVLSAPGSMMVQASYLGSCLNVVSHGPFAHQGPHRAKYPKQRLHGEPRNKEEPTARRDEERDLELLGYNQPLNLQALKRAFGIMSFPSAPPHNRPQREIAR